MLLVLLAQQAVWANGLTSKTRQLLKTGLLFKLEKPITSSVAENDTRERRAVLREIYLSSDRVNRAREIVEAEHGVERLNDFNYLLKLQEVADSLVEDVEYVAKLADSLGVKVERVTKDDVELDKIIKEIWKDWDFPNEL